MNRSTSKVLRDIKTASEKVFTWFQNNRMRANPNKFELEFSDTGWQGNNFYIEWIENFYSTKLLGIRIDTKVRKTMLRNCVRKLIRK